MSETNPTNIVRRSLKESAALAGATRKILKAQVASIKRRLGDPALAPGLQMELTALLLEILQKLDLSTINTAKVLAAAKHMPAPGESRSISPEQYFRKSRADRSVASNDPDRFVAGVPAGRLPSDRYFLF
jgi:hypothetical protein